MRIKYEADGINSMEIWIGNSTYVHASAAAALLPRFFHSLNFAPTFSLLDMQYQSMNEHSQVQRYLNSKFQAILK